MAKPQFKSWVEISAGALRRNAAVLKRVARPAKLIAVVKANAYGHDLPTVVKALSKSADWFAVDSLAEAQAVRRAGSRHPVVILGYTPHAQLATVVKSGFSQTVYDLKTAAVMSKVATTARPARLHLKIETGTARQGILLGELTDFLSGLKRLRHLVVEGVHTHYAVSEDHDGEEFTRLQLRNFEQAKSLIEFAGFAPTVFHTACSSAALMYPETRQTAIRTGLALYGLWPSADTERAAGRDVTLSPALAWKTVIAQVKSLASGTPIGYGLMAKTVRPTRIAVLPIGYYDGFDRGFSGNAEVLVHGRRCQVLGRICMNMCMIDVTDVPETKPEDTVTVIGSDGHDRISAEEFAKRLGTINYEVVTRINPLLPRVLVK